MNKEDKLVFDTKEDMERFIKNPPRILTEKEVEELYNNGVALNSH